MRFASEACLSCSRTAAPSKRREAERRQAHTQWSAPHSQMLPPDNASGADARHGQCPYGHRPLAGALASRRSAAALVAGRTLATRSRPRFTRCNCGGMTFANIALKPSTWLAGHNAGGDDARTARERLARPPAGTALAPPSGSHPESTLRGTSGGASTRRAPGVKPNHWRIFQFDLSTVFCCALSTRCCPQRIRANRKS